MTFNDGETSKTITFTAAGGHDDDDDESVKLGFGSAAHQGVRGDQDETTVNIGDDDDPVVTVMFGARRPTPWARAAPSR